MQNYDLNYKQCTLITSSNVFFVCNAQSKKNRSKEKLTTNFVLQTATRLRKVLFTNANFMNKRLFIFTHENDVIAEIKCYALFHICDDKLSKYFSVYNAIVFYSNLDIRRAI